MGDDFYLVRVQWRAALLFQRNSKLLIFGLKCSPHHPGLRLHFLAFFPGLLYNEGLLSISVFEMSFDILEMGFCLLH